MSDLISSFCGVDLESCGKLAWLPSRQGGWEDPRQGWGQGQHVGCEHFDGEHHEEEEDNDEDDAEDEDEDDDADDEDDDNGSGHVENMF